MKKLIECVPNFSEGRDMVVIKQITDEIEKIDGVKLLDVDPGFSTNRTVVTFVGTPEEVVEEEKEKREEALGRALGEAPELFVDNQRAAQGDRPSLPGAVRLGRDGRGAAGHNDESVSVAPLL